MTVVSLVSKPTAEDEVRAEIIALLREALADAEAGEIGDIVLIIGRVDGNWTNRANKTLRFSEAIGRLEITKQEWIAKFLTEDCK